jgi:hypothetical protein
VVVEVGTAVVLLLVVVVVVLRLLLPPPQPTARGQIVVAMATAMAADRPMFRYGICISRFCNASMNVGDGVLVARQNAGQTAK